MSNVEVTRTAEIEAQGRKIVVSLLKMGDQEGMTVPQAAEALGVRTPDIRMHANRNGLIFVTISDEIAKALRAQGVIPMRGRTPNFIPREALKDLVRLVGTPQAAAVYRALWAAVEDESAYVALQADRHTDDAGVLDDEAMANQFLKVAGLYKEEIGRRKEAERQRGIADKRAFSAMGTASAKAKETAVVREKLENVEARLRLEEVCNEFKALAKEWEKMCKAPYWAFGNLIKMKTKAAAGREIVWWGDGKAIANLPDLERLLPLARGVVEAERTKRAK